MTSSGMLCADLQIQLARLQIFEHARTQRPEMDPEVCESGELLLTDALGLLTHVGQDRQWLYPELLQGLAHSLSLFPVREIYAKLGFDETGVLIVTATVHDEVNRLGSLAASLPSRGLVPPLLALARYILESSRSGARNDEPLYSQLARLVGAERTGSEFVRHCNEWARETRTNPLQSPDSMLSNLFDRCPELLPTRAIAIDLMARSTHVIYAPLVVDETLGIAVPVEIHTDYVAKRENPEFHLFGNAELSLADDRVRTDFLNAVVRARQAAVDLLAKWNLRPAIHEFSVRVGLPGLDVEHLALHFTQGSLETPITLVLFLQHPVVQRLIPLDPEVMATGPIAESTLGPKMGARRTVGGASRLLVSVNGGRLEQRYQGGGLFVVDARDPSDGLSAYVSEPDRRRLYSRLSKIVVYGTYHQWDAPLQDAQPRRGQTRPLLTMERNQRRLTEAVDSLHAIQLRGMPGIGKSCLLAQWLEQEEVQIRYDVILFTSLIDAGRSGESGSIGKWVGPAIDELARHLDAGRGLGLLRKGLVDCPEGDERYVLELLRNCLGDLKVLWVIDNGESLLDEDGSILEPRFRALFTAIRRREVSWDLIFATNRKVEWPENLLEVLELSEGFTQPEAQEYLRLARWPYPTMYDRVATLLGGHPRALALLAGIVRNKELHQTEIYDLLERLPEGGAPDLQQKMCEVILDAALLSVKQHAGPSAWWTLLQTSTFLQDFSLREVQALQLSNPKDLPRGDPARDLHALDQRSLLNWADGRWWMHRLLRGYLQDRFQLERPLEFKQSHRRAGEGYFPLYRGHAHTTPAGGVLGKYSDASGCAAAFHHFETAEYEEGQRAIIENVYEHAIPRVQWLMRFGRRPSNPYYGYFGAERILRKVIEVYAGAEAEDSGAGARNVSSDINYLMARALYRQKMPTKLEEALLHCREAVSKGRSDAITLLVCVLCDVSKKGMTTEEPWNEAVELFQSVRDRFKAGVLESTDFLGEAYERITYGRWIQSQLRDEEPEVALEILNEAADGQMKWDRIYLLAADLAAAKGLKTEEERWLMRGLEQVPQSNPLWSRLCLIMAKNDSLGSIPEDLRKRPRGINSCSSLGIQLLDHGLVAAAKQCTDDGLRNYPDSPKLWAARGRVLEVMPLARQRKHAKSAYLKAIDLNPRLSEAYIAIAHLERSLGNKEEAIKVLESGCNKCPTDGSIPLALASIYEEEGRLPDAERAYRLAVQNSPTDGAAYQALAKFQERSGEIDVAMATLKLGCEKANSRGCYLELAQKQFASENTLEAIATCELGVAKCRTTDEFLSMYLGRLYNYVGRPQDAAGCYRRVIDAAPDSGAAYLQLARILQANGNNEEAVKTLKLGQVRSVDGSVPAALGQIYERTGDPVRAEEAYRAGITKIPTWGAAYIALARLQETQGNVAGALETLKLGCEAAPGDGDVPAALGQTYERTGDPVRAEDAYRAGITKIPTWGAAYIALARLQETQGNVAGALGTLKLGCEAAPGDGNIPGVLGQIYERMGEPMQAEEAYRTGIRKIPTWGAAYIELARLLESQGQIQEALEVLALGFQRAPADPNLPLALARLRELSGQNPALVTQPEATA